MLLFIALWVLFIAEASWWWYIFAVVFAFTGGMFKYGMMRRMTAASEAMAAVVKAKILK